MDAQVRLDQKALEFAVFQLQLEQPFGLKRIHAALLGALFKKAGVAEAVFAFDFLDRHARFGLPQKSDDLLFAVFAWFACPSFSGLIDFLKK